MNGHVNMGEACQDMNKGILGMLECMGEWEWLQEAFNGPKEKKTLKYNAWESLVKLVPKNVGAWVH